MHHSEIFNLSGKSYRLEHRFSPKLLDIYNQLMSEREAEEGYIDIYIEKAPHTTDIKYEWLIELKYLKKSERDKLEQVKKQGLEQLEKYVKSKNLADRDNLKKALLIFMGKKDYVIVEG